MQIQIQREIESLTKHNWKYMIQIQNTNKYKLQNTSTIWIRKWGQYFLISLNHRRTAGEHHQIQIQKIKYKCIYTTNKKSRNSIIFAQFTDAGSVTCWWLDHYHPTIVQIRISDKKKNRYDFLFKSCVVCKRSPMSPIRFLSIVNISQLLSPSALVRCEGSLLLGSTCQGVLGLVLY